MSKTMEELKEELLEWLAENKATLHSEGDDGICLTAPVYGDYFYFHTADELGFDV